MKSPVLLRATAERLAKEKGDAVQADYQQRLAALTDVYKEELADLNGKLEATRAQMRAQFKAAVDANREALIEAWEEIVRYADNARPIGRAHCGACAGTSREHGSRCPVATISKYARQRAEQLRAPPPVSEETPSFQRSMDGAEAAEPAPVTDDERSVIAAALDAPEETAPSA